MQQTKVLEACLDKTSEEKQELDKILYEKELEYKNKDYSSNVINEFISKIDLHKKEQDKLDKEFEKIKNNNDLINPMFEDLFKQIMSQVCHQMNLFEKSKIQIFYNMFISYISTLKSGDYNIVDKIHFKTLQFENQEILNYLENIGFNKQKKASEYQKECKEKFPLIDDDIINSCIHTFYSDKSMELESFFKQNEELDSVIRMKKS